MSLGLNCPKVAMIPSLWPQTLVIHSTRVVSDSRVVSLLCSAKSLRQSNQLLKSLKPSESCRSDPPCRNPVVQSLCHALHSVLGVGCDIDQGEPSQSFWGSTFMKLKKTNFLLFLSKGKHQCIPPPIGFSLYNYYYYLVACALTL
jgi:hypothetical protein